MSKTIPPHAHIVVINWHAVDMWLTGRTATGVYAAAAGSGDICHLSAEAVGGIAASHGIQLPVVRDEALVKLFPLCATGTPPGSVGDAPGSFAGWASVLVSAGTLGWNRRVSRWSRHDIGSLTVSNGRIVSVETLSPEVDTVLRRIFPD